MTLKRSYNLRGMDLSAGYNSDALWYLQDATVIGENAVRQRPSFPTTACANHGHLACASAGDYGLGSWGLDGSDAIRLSVFSTSTYANYSLSNVVLGTDNTSAVFKINSVATDATTLGDEAFFSVGNRAWLNDGVGGFVVRWGGSNANCVNSTSTTRTASTTNGSPTVTFSGSVTLQKGMYFCTSYNTWHRIIAVNSTTSITLDTNMTATASGLSWAASPWVFLIKNTAGTRVDLSPNYQIDAAPTYPTETIWNTVSGGEPTGIVQASAVCGHDGRLFVANGNVVSYSGTEDDVTGFFEGPEYWDADSRFVVAPEFGKNIQKMVSHNGDLLIFKDRSVSVLRGVVANGDPSRLGGRVETISTNLECTSPRHVIPTPAGILLINRHGIYAVTGEGVQRIGDQVWPRLAAAFGHELDGGDGPVKTSFVLDNRAYIYYSTNDDGNKEFATWDYLSGEWQFRTFKEAIAPGTAGSVLSLLESQTTNISFPYWSNVSPCSICYWGSEVYGGTDPYLFPIADTPSGSDAPQFIAMTSPIIGTSDEATHIRARCVWTNADVSAENDTNIYVVKNLGTTYAFDADAITSGSAGSYALTSSDESWKRNSIASDPYGWSKAVALVNNYDGSGSSQLVYLRGLIVEFDESGVAP